MTDYRYDVFISYRRTKLIQPWVSNYFLQYFEEYLLDRLAELDYPDDPRIFFDQIDNEPGDAWPQNLANALSTSKVLVSVCSPTYFRSKWCLSEWNSFLKREQFLNITGLRIPVRHNDCENYLQDIQWSDFSEYTTPATEWYQSAQAKPFYDKINEVARKVARAIIAAPPFAAWPPVQAPDSPSPTIPQLRI